MRMPKTAAIKARIDEDMLKELDEIVAAGPGDRSDHIRQALDIYIQDQRRRARFLNALAVATSGDRDHDSIGVIPS
jgi:metal-responsive CopG/Arc/MetJ family transcriptional regulator